MKIRHKNETQNGDVVRGHARGVSDGRRARADAQALQSGPQAPPRDTLHQPRPLRPAVEKVWQGNEIPWHKRIFRNFARVLIGRLFRIDVRGQLPKGGGVIVSNHTSYVDGGIWLMLHERVRPIARLHDGLAGMVFNPLVKEADSLLTLKQPTRRGLENFLREAVSHVRSGGYVPVAPEGCIHRAAVAKVRRGALQIAEEANAPIIPIRIDGATDNVAGWKLGSRPRLIVTIGEPFTPSGNLPADRKRIAEAINALEDSSV